MYEWGTAGAAGHQHTTPGQQPDGDQEAEQLLQGRWHDRKQAVLAVQQFATAQGKQAKVDTAQNGGSNVTLRCSSRLGNKGVLVSARYGFALWLESTIQLNLWLRRLPICAVGAGRRCARAVRLQGPVG